jgi:hypothetical protein
MWQSGPVNHRARDGTVGRSAAAVLAWLVGAACAVTVGALALSLIGSGLVDRSRPPLAAQITPTPSAGDASQSPAVSASPRPSPSGDPPSPSTSPVERTFTFAVGSVAARCDGDQAYLVSWSPAQGYRVDDVRRGPALVVQVNFETFTAERRVTVRCVAGIPRASLSGEGRR